MRFSLAVGLATLAATANGAIVGRQQTPGAAAGSDATPGSSTGTTPSSTPPSSSSSDGSDSTVLITETVTGDAKSTSTTTVPGSTRVSVVTSTVVDYTTTTVTSHDNDVATKTVYSTTTVQVNKRGIAPATPTATPAQDLAKRAVKTSTTIVTVHPSVTVVTISKDVVSTSLTTTTVVSTDTETVQANAKTTTTTTQIRTVTAVVVTQTLGTSESTSAPTNPPSNGNGGGSGGDSGGLSTGAKAGIGAGVGVAGLAIIGAAIFFCCRRRNRSPKPDPDMMAGASEVPVGSSGARPMSHASSGAAFRQPPVRTPVKAAPEGYRGTAMGDGRAGYAKPDPYGSSYGPSRSTTTTVPRNSGGADVLPEHPVPGSETLLAAGHMGSPTVSNVSPAPSKPGMTPPPQNFAHELGTDNNAANKWHNESAAEIDSQPVMGHQSGPVYEMPTETYR
ncbi:hypothetical protein PWT90_05718 [Aphanocladium album]|nr:hypothetical protein PWT90_05718 [Aphanocladium album]